MLFEKKEYLIFVSFPNSNSIKKGSFTKESVIIRRRDTRVLSL